MVLLKDRMLKADIIKVIKFTFHYGSIKSKLAFDGKGETSPFTFHYGSIKRAVKVVNADEFPRFTFHYGSIKRGYPRGSGGTLIHLHSTMVLLKDFFSKRVIFS